MRHADGKKLGMGGLIEREDSEGIFFEYRRGVPPEPQPPKSVPAQCVFVCVWGGGVQESSALERAPQKSTLEHIPFLRDQFPYMVEKGQLVLKL